MYLADLCFCGFLYLSKFFRIISITIEDGDAGTNIVEYHSYEIPEING